MSRYKLTTTDPTGKKLHYSSVEILAVDLGLEGSTLRHKLSKLIGHVIYIHGWKIKTEIHDPTPDGVWVLSGRKVYTAANLYACGNLAGVANGAFTRRWEALGKPDTFPYNGMTVGIGKYAGPPVVEPKPAKEAKPWRMEPEYTEDRIAPRVGGLLTAGYTVHGLGIRR